MSKFGIGMPVFKLTEGVKDEVVILPYGKNETLDGGIQFDFTPEDAAGVIALFKNRGIDLQFDWEHQSIAHLPGFENFKSPDGKAPASAWARDLVAGETGLVAKNVSWTPTAKAAIESGEYRYQSPVLVLDHESGKVKAIQCVGLTNEPRLKNIPALAARCDLGQLLMSLERKETDMIQVAAMLAALGLAASASEQEALGAITALKTKATAGESAAGQVTAFKTQAETSAAKVTELEGKLAKATSDLNAAIASVTTKDGEIAVFKTQVDGASKALADTVLAWAKETGRIAPAGEAAVKAQIDKDPAGMLAVFKAMPVGSVVPVGKITESGKGAEQQKQGESLANDPLAACKATAHFDADRLKIHDAAIAHMNANKGVSYAEALDVVMKK